MDHIEVLFVLSHGLAAAERGFSVKKSLLQIFRK